MLEDLNDYISFGVLIIISLMAIRILFAYVFNDGSPKRVSRIKSLANYTENEDE